VSLLFRQERKINDWSNKTIMKTHNYRGNGAFAVMIACLLFLGLAVSSDAQSRRGAGTVSDFKQPVSKQSVNAGARLIIFRIPNLGNHVVVDLYVDGAAYAAIGYGHTFDGFLPPGRHVLSLLPAPSPNWTTPWEMTLDVRNGETYSFTATGDDSQHLVLVGG
jgi:hypothetical protein